ncbi:MAG: hypothetical protein ACREPS_02425 [Rhodanobacteraceae bacterium]
MSLSVYVLGREVATLASVGDFKSSLTYHDGVAPDDFVSLTAPFTLVGMSVVLAYRFAAAMRRVEDFNYQLRARVDRATARLSDTLGREHALALANAQIGARLEVGA